MSSVVDAEAPPAVINPTAEDAYWRSVFRDQPYYRADLSYDDYSPAYRVGYTGPLRRHGRQRALQVLVVSVGFAGESLAHGVKHSEALHPRTRAQLSQGRFLHWHTLHPTKSLP